MSTQEQRDTIRSSRVAAGAAYAAAAQALVSAYVDLAAHDEVCGSAIMSDRPDAYPLPPLSFLRASPTDIVHLRHIEFIPQADSLAALDALVRFRVAALRALLG